MTVVATALANPAISAEEAISPERAANTIILDESGVQNLRIEMVEVELFRFLLGEQLNAERP